MNALPPPGEYWKAPPVKDKGDSSPDPILTHVGAALTQWEVLENTFSMLFAIFVEAKTHAARRAYGSMASTTSRRDALRNASEVFFTMRAVAQDFRDEFDQLLKHFQIASARRAEIAHGMCMGYTFGSEPFGHFLVPPDYNSRKTSAFIAASSEEDRFATFRANYRYTSSDIAEFSVRFGTLDTALIGYYSRLVSTYPQRQ